MTEQQLAAVKQAFETLSLADNIEWMRDYARTQAGVLQDLIDEQALAQPAQQSVCQQTGVCVASGLYCPPAEPELAQPAAPVAYSAGRTLHWHEGRGVTDAQLYTRPAEQQPVASIDTSSGRVEKSCVNVHEQAVQPAAIPEGWKLVPLKMTDEMLAAAKNKALEKGFMTLIWEAAVQAAPQQGEAP